MKRVFQMLCCGIGGSMIGYWAKLLDTDIGFVFFTLGVILVVGSLISIGKGAKTDKEET